MQLQELEYQEVGACFLAERKTALLADEPRLGKTIQAIRACDKAMVLRVLVICPAGVTENWRRMISALRQGDWSAFVVSYEGATEKYRASLMADEFDVIIIDEAHYIKELSSNRTRHIYGANQTTVDITKGIAGRGTQVWLLTGTPMPNHAGELYSHLRALFPQAVLSPRTGVPWTYAQFEEKYCEKKHTGFGLKVVGSKNEELLHKKLDGFMLRRRKVDVLAHIPPTTFEDLWIEGDVADLPGDEIALVRKTLAEHGVEGLRLLAARGSVATLRRLTGMAKVPGMRQWASDWLKCNARDQKIVLFAHHHEVIEALYDKLHVDFVRVNKFSKKRERQTAIDRFAEDPAVRGIIVRMSAEGVGISLARADEMVVIEPSWVPSTNDQVYERIVDLGKTRPNLVRTAMIAGSIDEDIQRAVSRKMESIAKVVDGVS